MERRSGSGSKSSALVSVVICTCNSEDYLQRTLETVLSQTYRNLEVVIVDDGSTDNTRALLGEVKELDDRVKVFYQEHSGLAEARNAAFRHASGSWIAIIDSDDLCYPSRVEDQLKVAQEHPEADLIFCNTDYIDENDAVIGDHLSRFRLPSDCIERGLAADLLLRYGCYVDTESVFMRRSSVARSGDLDPSFRYSCDYEYFIRLGLSGSFAWTKKTLAAWRIHSNQMTTRYTVPDKDFESLRIYSRYFWNSATSWTTRFILLLKMVKVAVRGCYHLLASLTNSLWIRSTVSTTERSSHV